MSDLWIDPNIEPEKYPAAAGWPKLFKLLVGRNGVFELIKSIWVFSEKEGVEKLQKEIEIHEQLKPGQMWLIASDDDREVWRSER